MRFRMGVVHLYQILPSEGVAHEVGIPTRIASGPSFRPLSAARS
jgi:hypothetical protein